MSYDNTKPEIKTPQAEYREKIAKEDRERKANTRVISEWVEIVKHKGRDQDGKVILKRITTTGLEHSWYVGRESKCQEYLLQMKAEGKLGRPIEGGTIRPRK